MSQTEVTVPKKRKSSSKEDSKKSKKTKSRDVKVVAETPEDVADKNSSKKRKREALPDEIEVDVNLPEPLSKKEARRAKKGKPNPKPSAAEDSSDEHTSKAERTQGGTEKKTEKSDARSEYGAWIGNLPWSATPDSLRTWIMENSEITSEQITRINLPKPTVPPNPNWTRKPLNKGFAYVDFSDQLAMYSAIALTETKMDGRALLIKNAKSYEGRPEKPKTEEDNNDTKAGKKGHPPNKRVFVGNLSFDVTVEDLTEHYGQCGEIADLHMATFEDSGKCKGYAWITFADVDAATSAVNGFVFKQEKAVDAGSSDEEDAPQKTTRRKWYVNRFNGRELRCEFAEDSATRYKKRYGKDKPVEQVDGVHPDRMRNFGGDDSSRPTRESRERGPRKKVDPRTIKSGAAHSNAPRAPQGIVESKGKKTTFD